MIEFEGLNNVLSSLQNETANMASQALQIMSNTGEDIYDNSQELVPILSGELKDSADIEIDQTDSTIDIEISYGNGDGYGSKYGIMDGYSWFVEKSTSKMEAQPYLKPPFEDETEVMLDLLKNLIGDAGTIEITEDEA